MGRYRTLDVWKLAYALTLDVYRVTRDFPASERYGMTDQLRRAALGIPLAISEGKGRDTDAELARYASIALGSANEVETLLDLSRDLGYLQDDRLLGDVARVARMLNGLREAARQGRRRTDAVKARAARHPKSQKPIANSQ